jgi:hypothetical protein
VAAWGHLHLGRAGFADVNAGTRRWLQVSPAAHRPAIYVWIARQVRDQLVHRHRQRVTATQYNFGAGVADQQRPDSGPLEYARGQHVVAGEHRPPLDPVGRRLEVMDGDAPPDGHAFALGMMIPLWSPPPWLAPRPILHLAARAEPSTSRRSRVTPMLARQGARPVAVRLRSDR